MNITVFHDDHPEEIIDKVRLALMEIGVKTMVVESADGYETYQFGHAERLDSDS